MSYRDGDACAGTDQDGAYVVEWCEALASPFALEDMRELIRFPYRPTGRDADTEEATDDRAYRWADDYNAGGNRRERAVRRAGL